MFLFLEFFLLLYLLYLQFKGLRDQYNAEVDQSKKIEDVEFNVMNSFGDVFDIDSKYDKPSFDEMDKEEICFKIKSGKIISTLFQKNFSEDVHTKIAAKKSQKLIK